MNKAILLSLLLLPSLCNAVVCRTVGTDGVVSFANVPAAACPQASQLPQYSQPRPTATESVERVDTGDTGSKTSFTGYRSVEISSPEDGGVERTNERRVQVKIDLEPDLEASHFIIVYLDGKAKWGRYGSTEILLTEVDPGEHELSATVKDLKGKTLARARLITFTLLRASNPLRFHIAGDKIVGSFQTGPGGIGWGLVTVEYPTSGKEEIFRVPDIRSWKVPFDPPADETRISVAASPKGSTSFQKSELIENAKYTPTRLQSDYSPGSEPDYTPHPVDYTPKGGAIPATPNQPNPAFTPNFRR